MKRKPLNLLLFTILAALFLSGCGGKKADIPATSEEGILKVGIVDGKDRFGKNEAGAPVGIEAELAKKIAAKGGYALQLTMAESSDDLLAGMLEGRYDLGFGRISDTDQRIGNLSVSIPYGKGCLYLATPKRNYMNCLTSVHTGTLGISVRAEDIKDSVKGIDGIVSQPYTDISLMSQDIANGNILAGLVTEREALSMIGDKVQAQELLDSPRESYVALLPGGSPLIDTVNGVIGEFRLEQAGVSQE